jgi:hypothetical protein
MFFFPHQWQMCHDFKYFDPLKFLLNKMSVLEIYIDPDRPDPYRHFLDADSDPDPDLQH